MAITQECCVQSSTSPGSNTPQDTNCTATCPLSRKTIQVRRTRHAGTLLEKQRWTHKRCTLMDPHTRPRKSRTTSTNVHSAAIWGYRLLSLKTCLGRWTIGRSGERGSGISVLPARYDDDDEGGIDRVFPYRCRHKCPTKTGPIFFKILVHSRLTSLYGLVCCIKRLISNRLM